RAVGTTIDEFLSRPMNDVRGNLSACVGSAAECDETADASIPAFSAQVDLLAAGAAREEFAARIENLIGGGDRALLARWAAQEPDAVVRAGKRFAEHQPLLESLKDSPLDAELVTVAPVNTTSAASIAPQLAALAAYLDVAPKWHAIFAFGKKSAAS